MHILMPSYYLLIAVLPSHTYYRFSAKKIHLKIKRHLPYPANVFFNLLYKMIAAALVSFCQATMRFKIFRLRLHVLHQKTICVYWNRLNGWNGSDYCSLLAFPCAQYAGKGTSHSLLLVSYSLV